MFRDAEEEALAENAGGERDDLLGDAETFIDGAKAAADAADDEMNGFIEDEKEHLIHHQVEHQLEVECPEGWMPRPADSGEEDAVEVSVEEEHVPEPCPMAYLAAPCPCALTV